MILDTSAVVAILLKEPEAYKLGAKIMAARSVSIGAPTLLELRIVMFNRRPRAASKLAAFLDEVEAVVIPFTSNHVNAAALAHERYGKGRHPAALNLGDCFSYATARVSGQPLLYTGDDFAKTDIEAA